MLKVEQPKTGWYLEYDSFDNPENHHSNALQRERQDLDFSDYVRHYDAVDKAQALWAIISAVTYQGWDKKTYPSHPMLVFRCEVPL